MTNSRWIEKMIKTGDFNPDFLQRLYETTSGYPKTERSYRRMESWWNNNKHVKITRPTWTQTHMETAYVYSKKSHDSQTKHGCVITTPNNRVLATGFNGFLSGIDDQLLPNIRPEKYPWMLHAELNAIFNCEHRPEGGIVYVTGHPCLSCYLCMCQSGIKEIVYDSRPERNSTMIDEEMMTLLEIAQFLTHNTVKLIPYEYVETN